MALELMLYADSGQVRIVAALFFGLKAAVLAIVLEAVLRIGRRALEEHASWWRSQPPPSLASGFSTYRSRSSSSARRSSGLRWRGTWESRPSKAISDAVPAGG